jgi:hypothetical protein
MNSYKRFRTRIARLVLGTTVTAVAAISFAGAASAGSLTTDQTDTSIKGLEAAASPGESVQLATRLTGSDRREGDGIADSYFDIHLA